MMMEVEAAIEVAWVSAVLGAISGGYFQARVARDQIEAEADRLRQQSEEDHLRHRQGVYHDALDGWNAYEAYRGGKAQPIPQLTAFSEAMNGVVLFGDDDVRAAVDRVNDALRRSMTSTPPSSEDWRSVYDALLEAMRADTKAGERST